MKKKPMALKCYQWVLGDNSGSKKHSRMKTLATFLLSLVLPVCGQAADDAIVSTMGKGVGASAEEALRDSFRDAVERAVGVFVDAEVQAENDELIRDKVLTQSNAYIEKYKKVSERRLDNGLLEVKIVAEVKKGELTRKLRDAMPPKTFSLGDELKRQYGERQKMKMVFARREEIANEQKRQKAAKEISQGRRDADAAALIKSTLADFNPSAIMFDVVATGDKPIVSEKDGAVIIDFDMKLRLSTEKYFNTLVLRFKQLFGQISLKPPKTISFILKRPVQAPLVDPFMNRIFVGCPVTVNVRPLPASRSWEKNIEVGGVECTLPSCEFKAGSKTADPSGEPSVWIVSDVAGTEDRKRVTMIGYFLADACMAALNEVVGRWAALPPVGFVAELVDASDRVVTAQNFHVAQDCGWIGWGAVMKPTMPGLVSRPFYVMPWLAHETVPSRAYRQWEGRWYDERGNYLGRKRIGDMEMPFAVVEVVPFRCEFKVLEDELKKVASIKVRVAE